MKIKDQTLDTQVEDILTEVMTMIQTMMKMRMPHEVKIPPPIFKGIPGE